MLAQLAAPLLIVLGGTAAHAGQLCPVRTARGRSSRQPSYAQMLDAQRSLREAGWRPTELRAAPSLARMLGMEHVFLKFEDGAVTGANGQPVSCGSFKIRGDVYFVDKLLRRHPKAEGLVTASRGNHASALALAGQNRGLQVQVNVPRDAPAKKIALTRSFGGQVVLCDGFEQAYAAASASAAERPGWFFAPGFDDLNIVAGQATAALELWSQLQQRLRFRRDWPERTAVLVPVGGGGLAGGLATGLRAMARRSGQDAERAERTGRGQDELRRFSARCLGIGGSVA